MRIPVWLTLGIAALVIVFGGYRLFLAFRRSDGDEAKSQPRSGFYRMSKRTHLLVGIVYLLLGAGLIATSFGWNPFGGGIGPSTEKPSKDKAPTKTSVPVDKLPQTK